MSLCVIDQPDYLHAHPWIEAFGRLLEPKLCVVVRKGISVKKDSMHKIWGDYRSKTGLNDDGSLRKYMYLDESSGKVGRVRSVLGRFFDK
jgi:hypothetical protein